ncbi:MAG: hypothetical protein LC132_08970, partial [Burkholderiales bacterium]|nr:hypothetical protein [Burkholderiales bacterium]
FKLPYDYSYAKYIDRHLVSNSGKHVYPSKLTYEPEDGFSLRKSERSLHCYYKTAGKVLIITRPQRSPLPYLVSLSYLFLFYGFVFALALALLRENDLKINLPGNSFRRKITVLLVGLLFVALVLMAIGSIGFGLKLYEETNTQQMQDQMDAARSSLEEYVRYADRSNDPAGNVVELMNTINRLSSNININVNLYDPQGRLMRSSQPEIFERHLREPVWKVRRSGNFMSITILNSLIKNRLDLWFIIPCMPRCSTQTGNLQPISMSHTSPDRPTCPGILPPLLRPSSTCTFFYCWQPSS